MNTSKKELLELAKRAAIEAGKKIMEIYNSGDFGIESKDDNSPLTLADKASHNVIVDYLQSTEIPILSEEGRDIPFEERKNWNYFWMLDPLDGTKEFVKKNGEFTVNIALIHQSSVVLGAVYTPVIGDLYWAVKGEGAFKNDQAIKVKAFKMTDASLSVVASRSHLNEETQTFLDSMKEPKIVSKGSSLKFLMVAEGEAHLYPRYAPTMEWDTAAAQIIVEEAGGEVLIANTNEGVNYNKQNLLNPHFLVRGLLE